jgi:hypothetical protein
VIAAQVITVLDQLSRKYGSHALYQIFERTVLEMSEAAQDLPPQEFADMKD